MKWMQWIIYAGMVTLWAASGTADATENANGGAPGAWDQQLQSRDLTGKRGQEQVDLHTGSFNYSIPINCAPARNGSQPALALTYTSGAENGWCGMGWRLDLGYIERNTKDGFPIQYTTAAIPMPATAYDDTKGFLLNLYGKESKLYAVATNSPTVEYRAETDTEFLRCLLNTNNNNWTVYDKSGNAYHFGQSSSSRVANPKTGWSGYSGTFHWGLDEVDSATGDQTTVAYTTYNDPVMSSLPERTIYPSTITYNGHTNCNGYTTVASGNGTISFATEIRPDQRNSYRWGFRAEQNRRLTNIVCKVGSQKVWRYALGYTTSTATGRSLLSSVTAYGSDDSTALPVQTFTYQQNPNGVSFGSTMAWTNMILSDLSGAGGTDPCLTQINDSETTIADLFDIDGDGLPDRVSYCYGGGSSSDTYQVQHNNGVGGFGARYTFGPASSSSSSTASDANLVPASGVYSALNGLNTRLHDINGDGLPDRINDWWKHYDSSGLYQYTNFVVMTNTGNGFGSAYLWPLATNDMAYDQNNYMSVIDAGPTEAWAGLLDINGDGLPDRVMGLYNQPTTYFKVQYNTGTGFAPVKYFGPMRCQNYTNGATGNAWAAVPQSADSILIDMNGDGLPDHVMMPMSSLGAQLSASADTYFAVEFNDGYSFESTNTSTAVPGAADIWSGVNPEPNNSGFQAIQNAPYVGMYDLNGDGLPDRVMLNPTNMYSANPSWLVYLNNGRGFNSVPILVSNIDNQGEYSTSYIPCWGAMEGTLESSVATMLIDINGDGLLDRVMNVFNGDTSDPGVSTTANYFLVQLNDGPFPDLLTNVNNGMGGNYAITYLPSTTYNNHLDANDSSSGSVLPFIYQTVATVTESDGVNAARTTAYGYAGGYYNGPRREFHGFAAVSVTNPPSPISASYDRVTVHYYHQGGGQDHSTIGEYGDAGAFAKDGMEYRTESYGNDGNLYHVTVNQINQTYLGNGRYFPYVQQTFECDYVPGGTNRVTATQLAYDLTTGNLTNKIIYGEVTGFSPSSVGSFSFNNATTADDQHQNIYYASLSGNSYIVDHPSKISLADASGNVFQEEDYTYDPTSGAPTSKLALITAGYYATNSYGNYDTYGLATLATDPVGVQTVLGYDSTYTFQTTKHLRATPGSDSSSDLTTTNYYDARSGLVTNSTAITGVSVTNAYDALYRLTASGRIAVGGSSVWMKRVSYNLGSISSGAAVSYLDETDNDGVGGVETRTYVDGFDRPIQERIQGENSNFRVVSVAYDELGKIFLTTWPSFGSSATFAKPSSQTAVWIGYDAAGRVATNRLVTATFNSAGAFSSKTDLGGDTGSLLGAKTWNYANGSDPWWVVFTDEDSKVRRYGLDAFGRTNQIQEVNGSTYYTTTLKYNVAGDMTNIVNANSENIYFAYNDLGDVVAMADPNLGQWTYVRDYAGRVRLQTDARENVVSNSYINPSTSYQDPAGRLRVQTVFGTNYTNHVLMPAFTNTYAYDASDNGNFTVCKGLLYKVTDSEGAETNGYDSLGRLTNSVRHLNMNGENYTTSYSYNDGDKLTSTVYPNGGPTVTNLYFTGGSLKQVSRSGGTELYYTVNASAYDQFGHATNFAYGNGLSTTLGYYPISERLKNISCGSSGAIFNRTYTYSAANDILTIVGTGITNSGNTVTVTYDNLHRVKTYTGLTGSYGYDVVGTMTTNIETGNAQTYAFGVRRPQAVRSAFASTNLYDLCGNMIVRQAGLTNSQSLVYDAENRLVRFSQATTNLLLVKFGYSADGARLWKWDNQAATNLQVWIGNIYEEKKGKVLYHVYAGGQQVCSFETNSTLFGGSDTNRVAYYYHEDDLNSSTALSSGGSSGSQIEVNAYYPFGRVMTASPQASFKVSRQFTGQVKDDDTGLYYYNARYYDPLLGRFIQADTTIPDLGNPQSYNRYSYCLNNPLSYNDPSGHDPAFTPGMSMFEGLSVQQRYTASRAALPATVGMTVAAASGGVAAPLLVSVGASAGFAAVGSGLIAGATGDLAAQGTQIGLGQRQSISGQEVAVSSLAGGALNGAVGKLASLRGAPETAPKVINLNGDKYPVSAANLEEAGAVNIPLTVNRAGAAANRTAALQGLPKIPGHDLDEAPPAMLRKPGDPVVVRPTPPADNRGAGASIGNQAKSVPDGGKVVIKIQRKTDE